VRVTGSAAYSAVLLPDEAVGSDQTNKFVYAVDADGTVVRKTEKLGPLYEALSVVREGLLPDEGVITKGLQRARPGIKVAPTRVALTTSDAAKAANKVAE
ncbi:MAG: efflux transporter periplasmic adaptor subunit, partial [Variovorax sp.]